MTDITQLSLFSQYQPHDDRPLPLRVAEKWSFSLSYIDRTGNPDDYLYCARDWYIGLEGDRGNWSRQKSDWLDANPDWSLNYNQFQKVRAYLVEVKRPYRPVEQLEFVDEKGLYAITQRMYEKPGKKMSAIRGEILNYLAAAGVLVDQIIRDPEKAEALKIAAWRKQGRSEQWIAERTEGQKARSEITASWQSRGAIGQDFAILTNEVNTIALGRSATRMTRDMQVKPGQLRNNLDEAELGVIRVTESAASTLHALNDSQGTSELRDDIRAANPIAEIARKVFGAAKRKR